MKPSVFADLVNYLERYKEAEELYARKLFVLFSKTYVQRFLALINIWLVPFEMDVEKLLIVFV
jgi:hypothetical protein